jgi:type I restriction enzyme S subunit
MQQQSKTEHSAQYKKTELGLLPESWEVVRFEDIGKFQYGYTETSSTKKIGPKFLRITDIDLNSSRIFWETVPYCKIIKEEFPKYALGNGDILIARIGATTGKTCIIRDAPESVFASYLIRFSCNKQKVDPEYCYLFTISGSYWEQVNANKEGKLKKGVSSSQLKNFKISLPPLPEQQKIAHVLSTIQTAKEKIETVITALKEMKQSIMKHLFTYGPVNSKDAKYVKLKDAEIGQIPEEWNISELVKVAHLTMGQSPPGNTYNEENKGMPFLQGKAEFGQIHPTHIKYTSKPLKIAKRDSVLLSVRAPVGDVNIADIDYCIGRGLASISSINGSNRFLFYLLVYSKPNIEKEGTGSTFKAINKNKLQNLMLPNPPLEIQEKIASMLSAIDDKIETEKTKKNSLDNLFKSILHNLMTAKIRVNELVMPNEEKRN